MIKDSKAQASQPSQNIRNTEVLILVMHSSYANMLRLEISIKKTRFIQIETVFLALQILFSGSRYLSICDNIKYFSVIFCSILE